VEAIRTIAGREHLCFEEGTQSAWLYEILSPRVQETVVAMPRYRRGQKNDALDAYVLAEKLRTGQIERDPRGLRKGDHSEALERRRVEGVDADGFGAGLFGLLQVEGVLLVDDARLERPLDEGVARSPVELAQARLLRVRNVDVQRGR
jgi:hypothetical protein